MNRQDKKRHDKMLKNRAFELFVPDLAAEVRARVDADRARFQQYESVLTGYQGDRLYNSLKVGAFEGLPAVTWNGKDRFVFTPHPTQPFAYLTSSDFGNQRITPGAMPTDGGSTPRLLRGLTQFSSWGYAPAFIIHDWIYYAKKRRALGDAAIQEPAWSFEDSALIMAEAMKTLMETGYRDFSGQVQRIDKAEDVMYLMYVAVSCFIAKRVWDDDSTVASFQAPAA